MSLKDFIEAAKNYKCSTKIEKLKDQKAKETEIFEKLYNIKKENFNSNKDYRTFYLTLHDFFYEICKGRMIKRDKNKGFINSDFRENVIDNLSKRGKNKSTFFFYLGKILSHSYSFTSVFKKKYRNKIKEINGWFLERNPENTKLDCGFSQNQIHCNVCLELSPSQGN